jgi:hypothetical protein
MGEQVRLCRVVQGVEFTVDEQGVLIRALILRDALEAYFGAADSPQSWMRSYKTHRDAIDCAAADSYRADPSQNIVVLSTNRPRDFDHVRIDRQARRNKSHEFDGDLPGRRYLEPLSPA